MSEVLKLSAGDQVRLKKAHPCGSTDWEILRAGADVKTKCLGCGRIVAQPRVRFERRVRAFLRRAGEPPPT
jgi:hypothetical protein